MYQNIYNIYKVLYSIYMLYSIKNTSVYTPYISPSKIVKSLSFPDKEMGTGGAD